MGFEPMEISKISSDFKSDAINLSTISPLFKKKYILKINI